MLGWSLLACAALYAALRVFGGYGPPSRPLRRLRRREVATLEAAGEAVFPPGGALPSSGSDADLAGYLDRLLEAMHPRARRQIQLLLFLVEHATLVFPAPGWGGFRRYSALSLEQRQRVLEAWADSHIFSRRLVFLSLRALLTMGYFAHRPVLRHLGLAPFAIDTPLCPADLLLPRVGESPDSISYDAADLGAAGAGTPLALDGPLHPAYADEES